MEIREHLDEGILFLRPVTDRFDSLVAGEVKSHLSRHISAGRTVIAINLEDVEFMDSAGLGALISVFRMLGYRGKLMLYGVNEAVRGLLQITSMLRIFPVFDSEDAVRAAQASSVGGPSREGPS